MYCKWIFRNLLHARLIISGIVKLYLYLIDISSFENKNVQILCNFYTPAQPNSVDYCFKVLLQKVMESMPEHLQIQSSMITCRFVLWTHSCAVLQNFGWTDFEVPGVTDYQINIRLNEGMWSVHQIGVFPQAHLLLWTEYGKCVCSANLTTTIYIFKSRMILSCSHLWRIL